jgi:hypothetical protein
MRRFWYSFFLNSRHRIIGTDNLRREIWWAYTFFAINHILECISNLILLDQSTWVYFRYATVIDCRIAVLLWMSRNLIVLILVLGSRIKHEGVLFVICGVIYGIFNSDSPQHFISLPHTFVDPNLSFWGDLSQLLINIWEIVMDYRLVMLFVESEKVTIWAMRGFSWTNSAFVKNYLDFSKIRTPRPGFEYTLTYVLRKFTLPLTMKYIS